ncbi:MAG: bifunctional tRNA pseudouridine(32) synthase/ribosomal large subunit pseudouridine synthase RluA [Cellvibrionaceae bacterium]|nr:bifunctional tRNA pseudouridine(32) synthase/ribosomal large subunit pseudouridine synthase RluA [Cellvibrionaceae bacterium]|tara:strand:+ start:22660 stop:23289 length:630 start_codon:yes stop_codon:yes gene_type:complete
MNLEVVYQDQHLIAVNKPSGLLSVPGRGPENQDCVIARAQSAYPDSRIIHRLDMATSGLLLIAHNLEALRAFSKLFEKRLISKRYVAVVHGMPDRAEGDITEPLICDWPNRPKQKVCWETGKSASTHYRITEMDRDKNRSRVELTPHTGRSHQLRVHMLTMGHPILGDEFYGHEESQSAAERLLLHATQLCFEHPFSGEQIHLTCECDF